MSDLEALSPKEVAQRLHLAVGKVWALIRAGAIPAKDVSGGKKRPTYRVPREQFERWLTGERK